NKSAPIVDDISTLALKRGAEICYHSRQALSRISKNAKQDQGVAVDLVCSGLQTLDSFLQNNQHKPYTLLALDGITNPQNLGMIIRSATAGNIDGIILPNKGSAGIDPLVIKASAGTVFRATLLRTEQALTKSLQQCREQGADICGLSSHAAHTLKEFSTKGASVFVLGNETDGISREV